MVYLYGVTHGGQWIDFLSGRSGEIDIIPTKEMIEDLSRFPKGTKIGLEALSKKDWGDVNLDLFMRPFDPPEPRFEDDKIAMRPYYEDNNQAYWKNLEEICLNFGFEVVFLENKNIWLRYNESVIKMVENEATRRNLLCKEEGESDEDYARKLIRFNSERYKENILSRKIHEIERDDSLLGAIKSSKVDISINGIAHSDYWVANSENINSRFGFSFEGYSAEVAINDLEFFRGNTLFVNNLTPDPKRVFERQCLERTVKLIETGRISDREPRFIGTWNIHSPYNGYFEIFVDKSRNGFCGEIIDCLGDADFEGEISDKEIKFTKKYKQEKCLNRANKKEIAYRGIIRNGNVFGFYENSYFLEQFYATPGSPKNIIDLGMSWYDYERDNKPELENLAKGFFN
ncbi:MAG: hypothetical protein Q7S74_03820 [Nanoarchaeota archaeon]|nr:hypothetical protein [Nanoarchaeota archaeon]